MGVLAKLFKRSSGSTSGAQSSHRSAIEIEPKPRPTEAASEFDDQAARLRAAVATNQVEPEHVRSSGSRESFTSDESEDWQVEQDELPSGIDEGLEEVEPGTDGAEASGRSSLAKKSKAPRSKQELIEELHRNYQEVLGLVRKLDHHLDDAKGRSETIAEVAQRYDELAPAIEHLPHEIREAAKSINADLRTAMGEEGNATRELLDRIESAIVHVGTDIERSTNQQGQLVQTMAEFRESLLDLSRSSTAACEVVRDFEQRAVERDNAMLLQMRQTRHWLIGLTVAVAALGVTGVILGIIALSG